MASLTPKQVSQVSQWVADGLSLSQIQGKISAELGVSMTYMDARFLVDDLNLSLVEKEEPKKEEEPRQKYPTVTGVPPKTRTRAPIITGATTPRLLADALAAYRPAGAIEGKGTGDERQDVWNEKSLRLRDALGL